MPNTKTRTSFNRGNKRAFKEIDKIFSNEVQRSMDMKERVAYVSCFLRTSISLVESMIGKEATTNIINLMREEHQPVPKGKTIN